MTEKATPDFASLAADLLGARGFDDISVKCPNTGIPLLLKTPLRATVVVPDDVDAVLELIEGRLNTHDCACGSKHNLSIPIVAVNAATGDLICVTFGASEADMRHSVSALVPPFKEAKLVDDYDKLRVSVFGWLDALLLNFVQDLQSGKFEALPLASRIARRHKMLLVYLRYLVEGPIPPKVVLADGSQAPPDAARRFYDYVHLNVLKGQLDDLEGEFGPARLLGEAEQRIPKGAISETLLHDLAVCAHDNLKPLLGDAPVADVDEERESDEFFFAFIAGMKNAVAHAIANRENPQLKGWAPLIRRAWQMYGGGPDDPLLPPPEQASRLVRFESLWNQCRHEMQALQTGEYRPFLDDLERMFTRLGLADRYLAMLKTGVIRIDAKDQQRLADAVLAKVTAPENFNVSAEQSYKSGTTAGFSVRNLLSNGKNEPAKSLVLSYLEAALTAKDEVAAVAFGTEAIRIFSSAERPEEALPVADKLMTLFRRRDHRHQLADAPASLTVSFWNECGNLFRYIGKPEVALGSYKIARDFVSLIPEGVERADAASVLELGEGLAMRDLGRFDDAFVRIAKAADQSPASAAVQLNFAMLLAIVGRFAQAEAVADRAIAQTDAVVTADVHARALVVRAEAKRMLLRPAEALADIERAMAAAPASTPSMKVRIAYMASQISNARALKPDLMAEAEAILRNAIELNEREGDLSRGVMPAAVGGLGQILLDEGREPELYTLDRDVLDPFLAGLHPDASVDWRLLRLKGLIEKRYNIGWNEVAWNFLATAAAEIDMSAPGGADARFAGGWLTNKEAFQLEFIEATVAMVAQGTVPATDLLRAYELANGRELAASLGADGTDGQLADLLKTLKKSSVDLGQPVLVTIFLDTPECVRVLLLNADDGSCILLPEPCWTVKQVEQAAGIFIEVMDTTNPAAPEAAEKRLTLWRAMMAELGAAIAPHLTTDALVAVLPGRRMSNLPLHLMMLPDGRGELLLSHPVVFAANLALLIDQPSQQPQPVPRDALEHSRMVVACAKDRDSRTFRLRLATVARRIAHLGVDKGVLRLSGHRATPQRVLASIKSADTLILLCHGAQIGQRKGYGLYLSDGHDLPPALAIDIDLAPDIGPFALAWADFASVERTPRLIVSLACSSARTILAPGGVRIGPEAAAFSKGTEAIIAPLWNVDQQAALAWIERFDLASDGKSVVPVWDAYRHACIDVRASHKNAFFWGAFIFNGRLQTQTNGAKPESKEKQDA